MRALLALLALLAVAAGCTPPPPDAYVGGAAKGEVAVALGQDASGEACNQLPGGRPGSAEVFCGTWQQPAAVVSAGPQGTGDALLALGQRRRVARGAGPALCLPGRRRAPASSATSRPCCCNASAGSAAGRRSRCCASVDGRTWLADGILPTLPVMERSIGILSGRIAASAATTLPPSAADALLANQLAARAFGAGDVGQFDALMTLGARANLAENFAPAEQAYRAALAIQQKALGPNDPDTAEPLMHLALQVSDEGRFAEADTLFARAETLAPRRHRPPRRRPAAALPRAARAEPGPVGAGLALLRRAETGLRGVRAARDADGAAGMPGCSSRRWGPCRRADRSPIPRCSRRLIGRDGDAALPGDRAAPHGAGGGQRGDDRRRAASGGGQRPRAAGGHRAADAHRRDRRRRGRPDRHRRGRPRTLRRRVRRGAAADPPGGGDQPAGCRGAGQARPDGARPGAVQVRHRPAAPVALGHRSRPCWRPAWPPTRPQPRTGRPMRRPCWRRCSRPPSWRRTA